MATKKKDVTLKNSSPAAKSTSSLLDAAEKRISSSPPVHPGMNGQTPEQLIHELQVHQIELEIQADELRAAHNALEESRDQYLDLYEFAPIGYITLKTTAIISRANLTVAGLLGTERIKLINTRFRTWIAPKDHEIWDRYFAGLLKSEEKITTILMLKRSDGTTFPARLESICLSDINNGSVIRLAISDISDIKIAEKSVQRSEERLRLALRNAPVSVTIQDKDLVFQWGYNSPLGHLGETKGKKDTDLFLPEEAKDLIDLKRRSLETEKEVHEKIWLTIDGKRFFLDMYIDPLRDETGQITGIGVASVDLTDQKLVDEELRKTKNYLDNLITYANAPIVVWDPKFKITLFNRAVELLTGWKEKDILGKPFHILIPDDHMGTAMDLIRTTMNGDRWESVEIPILHKNGEIRTVIWNSATILGADGKTVVCTIAQGQDITERRMIEAEYRAKVEEYESLNVMLTEEIIQRNISDTTLKKTLSLLNASLESTADGIFVVDKQGKITSYNQNFVTMWNIPLDIMKSGEKERVIHHVIPQLKNPDEFLANIDDFQSRPGCESFDMIEFQNGKIFERYSKSQIIGDHVVGRVWSIRDITERRHAEDKLVASVLEKEVLLREIHHRVKNNLQLISGLLDMTRMRTVDESTKNILTDMMLKIQTMAQIHTRLFESKQFGRISIPDQIRDQIAALSNIFSHKGHDITCEIHSKEVYLPVDQALPCSLAINEILSNAYKHAFKGRTVGTIDISIWEEKKHIHITIHDDGIEMPDDVDIRLSNSLGMKLIRTLIQHQLKGTFAVQSDNGTKITIDFPIIVEET
ncbi:MAG: PAS domain S-box protein [Methanobacteriota archaeon]